MATEVTISPANLRVGSALSVVGMIPVSITVDDTYATPTGVTIDFTDVLVTIPKESRPVHADLVRVTGRSDAGYLAVFTRGASEDQFTCRLWSGTTEHSDAACSQVIQAELFFAPGAQS